MQTGTLSEAKNPGDAGCFASLKARAIGPFRTEKARALLHDLQGGASAVIVGILRHGVAGVAVH